jgi:parallel beta-helix repeat protein
MTITTRWRRVAATAGLCGGLLAAAAPGAFAAAPVKITSCNQVVTADARLAADLTCTKPADGTPLNGIIVGADGITIDLRGHTLTAPDSFNTGPFPRGTQNGVGVVVLGHDHVHVTNGKLTGWTSGVVVRAIENADPTPDVPAVDNKVSDISVLQCGTTGNNRRGIDVAEPGADGNRIVDNSVKGANCTAGIRLHEAARSTVRDNVVRVGTGPVGDGLVIDCGSANVIRANTLRSNGRYGVLIGQSPANTITHNKISDNLSHGIFLGPPISGECTPDAPTLNAIGANTISGNAGSGIKVGSASGLVGNPPVQVNAVASANLINANTIDANGIYGVDLEDGGNTLLSNEVSRNWAGGVFVPSNGSMLRRTDALRNHGDGIKVTGISNALGANFAALNGGGGIAAGPSNFDTGKNVGAGNADAAHNCVFDLSPCF